MRYLAMNGRTYVCQTCHKKLIKSKIPAQSVWYKLDTTDFPGDLNTLNRLERVIIATRILFKKVTIMPKGQSPKLQGSICNVSIDTRDITNVLPRGAEPIVTE